MSFLWIINYLNKFYNLKQLYLLQMFETNILFK